MVSAVIPELSFSVAMLNAMLSTPTNAIRFANTVKKFAKNMEDVRQFVIGSSAALAEWRQLWWDKNNPPRPRSDAVYRYLWQDHWEAMSGARDLVERDIGIVNKHLKDILGAQYDETNVEAWVARHGKYLFERFRSAFGRRDSILSEAANLLTHVKELQGISERRCRELQPPGPDATNLGGFTSLLGGLYEFGLTLYQSLPHVQGTSGWSLELYLPEAAHPALNWQNLDSLEVWFSFFRSVEGHEGFRPQRVKIHYTLAQGPDSATWVNRVTSVQEDGTLQKPLWNPALSWNPSASRKTRSYRELFTSQFFDQWGALDQWKADQAYLVLSVASWSMLLFKSGWTKNLCCHGLRFTSVDADVKVHGISGTHLPSLSLVPHHHPAEGLAAAPNDVNADCNHDGPKLKNIGVVLAEAIWRIPLKPSRNDPSRYERWDPATQTWTEIHQDVLLRGVESNSSNKVKEAIAYCLNHRLGEQDSQVQGMPSFYARYVKNVLEP
jgi:hypothetical protein